MIHLIIAFLSPMFEGLSTLAESFLSNREIKNKTTMIFYVSLMNVVFLPLITILGAPTFPNGNSAYLYILIGIIDFLWLFPYFAALKIIDTSIVAALLSLGQVTIPIMSYLILDECLELHQYIGFIVIILSSMALSIKFDKEIKINKAFYYMLIVSLILSFRMILVKLAMNIDKNWINAVVYPNFISLILPFSFLCVKKYKQDIAENFCHYVKKIKIFALNEFLCFLGMACSIFGLSQLSPVLTSAINATQPIFLLAISGFLIVFYRTRLKEKTSTKDLMKKIFFFITIIWGVILVIEVN